MQRVSAGFAPVNVADQHGEGAAVGRRVGDKIIPDRVGPGCFQQGPVRPKQLEFAIEIRRPQPQVDAVTRVGRERPHVQITQGDGSSRTGTIGHGAAFITSRHNEGLGNLSQMQFVSAGAARHKAADQHREGAAIGRRIGDKIIPDRIGPDCFQ